MIRINLRRLNLILVILAALIPNLGLSFSTFGFHWTFSRILFFISFILFIFNEKGKIAFSREKMGWEKLMAGWLVYGVVLFFLSSYAPLHEGIVELTALFNGFLCVLIFTNLKTSESDIDKMMTMIFIILNLYIIFGLFEILTGFHLSTSKFYDKAVIDVLTYEVNQRGAAGLMYGVNDFSALITCLLPVGLYKKEWKPVFLLSVIGVVLIDYINDANICIFAILIGIIFYFVFIAGLGKRDVRFIQCIFTALFLGGAFFVLFNIKKLSNIIATLNVILVQVRNYRQGFGSLYARMVIYADSIKASFDTCFIGTGPASFPVYFTLHPSRSGLINPHNLYLEILFQYGLVIMIIFAANLIRLILLSRNKFRHASDSVSRNKYLAFCEIFVVYSIVCLASSSFIGYAYQWMLIGIGSIFIGRRSAEYAVGKVSDRIVNKISGEVI